MRLGPVQQVTMVTNKRNYVIVPIKAGVLGLTHMMSQFVVITSAKIYITIQYIHKRVGILPASFYLN